MKRIAMLAALALLLTTLSGAALAETAQDTRIYPDAAEDQAGAVYTVTFIDQNGDPVPGCVVNFCTDEACMPVFADEDGVAVFTGEPYAYHLQVIRVPEGYEFDSTLEFYTEAEGGELVFEVDKQP